MIDYENPSQPELNEEELDAKVAEIMGQTAVGSAMHEEVAAARTPEALDKVPKEASEASSEPASLEETLAKIENGDADFDMIELTK